MSARWFAWNPDERRDAERVAMLQDVARRVDDPIEATQLLAEADELRAKWNRPRRRFQSVAELVEELQAIARDALEVDITDSDALDDLASRVREAGHELEKFAMDVEMHGDDEDER